jgi:sigma-B regulation protein RsbU (phosphoserine phosphatase)
MCPLFRSRAPEVQVIEPVPTVFPKIEGADIAAVFLGNRIAGDFYDSVRVSPERVLFGLLDVAGRREDTRNLLRKAQEIFRTAGVELFSGLDINESEAMTHLSIQINRGLIDASSGVHSCPAFIACYHEKFGTLCYTNAGHTPGLLRDDSGVSEIRSTGLPLGLFSHATQDSPTVAVAKNAALVLVSRGVVECSPRGQSNHEFGLEGIKQALLSTPPTDAKSLCTSILNAADEFSCKTPMNDDRTALALVRTS